MPRIFDQKIKPIYQNLIDSQFFSFKISFHDFQELNFIFCFRIAFQSLSTCQLFPIYFSGRIQRNVT
jgi:hypothetical protein